MLDILNGPKSNLSVRNDTNNLKMGDNLSVTDILSRTWDINSHMN